MEGICVFLSGLIPPMAVLWMTHQFNVVTAQKHFCLTLCVRAGIAVMQNDSSSANGFPDFPEHFWQTNASIPFPIDCSTLL